MNFTIEQEQESDGRWLAEVMELPGVLAYGATPLEAVSKAEVLALRVIAERERQKGKRGQARIKRRYEGQHRNFFHSCTTSASRVISINLPDANAVSIPLKFARRIPSSSALEMFPVETSSNFGSPFSR